MQSEPPSEFEAAVFAKIASETSDEALRAQLTGIRVVNRNYTGVGCYSQLVPPEDAPVTLEAYGSHGPLSGPWFETLRVEHGGSTLLWFKDGRAEYLEIAANGDHFPEDQADLVPFTFTKGP